ncbi:hypothetical protein B0H13DRAFT_2121301, partial [Mycena leptocephala]
SVRIRRIELTMPDERFVGAYVRTATLEDLDEIAGMKQRAFISSPVQTFFSGAKAVTLDYPPKDAKRRGHQTKYIEFVLRKSWSLGLRITVVAVPATDESPSLISSLRMGLLSVWMNWGIGVMARISDLTQPIKHALRDGYAERKLPGTPQNSWCLQLVGVDPEFQGQGYLSMLLREAFEHAPNAVFTLVANTPHARDVYKHFGFEVVREVTVGKGKVDALGLASSGAAATGFPMYPMIKVP